MLLLFSSVEAQAPCFEEFLSRYKETTRRKIIKKEDYVLLLTPRASFLYGEALPQLRQLRIYVNSVLLIKERKCNYEKTISKTRSCCSLRT